MSADKTVQFFITYKVLSWIFSPLILIKAWQNRYNKYYYCCCLYSNSIDEEGDPGRDEGTTQRYPRSKVQRPSTLCSHYLTKRGKSSTLGQVSWKQTLRFAHKKFIGRCPGNNTWQGGRTAELCKGGIKCSACTMVVSTVGNFGGGMALQNRSATRKQGSWSLYPQHHVACIQAESVIVDRATPFSQGQFLEL